jgi:hypothetical protein
VGTLGRCRLPRRPSAQPGQEGDHKSPHPTHHRPYGDEAASDAISQKTYELLRPVVLFGDPAIQRAKETGEPRTSLERKADDFDTQSMVSLFASRPRNQPQETARSLPPDIRQLIVDLRVDCPACLYAKLRRSASCGFIGGPLIIRSSWCWLLARLHPSRCVAFLDFSTPLILHSVATTLCSFTVKGATAEKCEQLLP